MATHSATGSRLRRRLIRAASGSDLLQRVTALEARLDAQAASMASLSASLDSLHNTVAEIDPTLIREMLVAVRDDVARTAAELTALTVCD